MVTIVVPRCGSDLAFPYFAKRCESEPDFGDHGAVDDGLKDDKEWRAGTALVEGEEY